MITLCIIVRNQATRLVRAVNSVGSIARELVVVDTSTDNTAAVATDLGARVIYMPPTPATDFAALRNIGLAHVNGTWILVLDADEELDSTASTLLPSMLETAPDVWGFYVWRYNYIGRGWSLQPLVRLFRRKPELRFAGRVWETVDGSIRAGGGRIVDSPLAIHHRLPLPSSATFRAKLARYLVIAAEELEKADDPLVPYWGGCVATLQLLRGRFDESLSTATTLVERWPTLVVPRVVQAHALRLLGDYEGAARVCQAARVLPQARPMFNNLLGILTALRGEHDRALDHYHQALSGGSADPLGARSPHPLTHVYYNLACAHAALGDSNGCTCALAALRARSPSVIAHLVAAAPTPLRHEPYPLATDPSGTWPFYRPSSATSQTPRGKEERG